VGLDSLIDWTKQQERVHPTIVWFLKSDDIKIRRSISMAIAIIREIGNLPGAHIDSLLIGIAENDRSVLSGYASDILHQRLQYISDPALQNRIYMAIGHAAASRYWPVRMQALSVLSQVTHNMAEEISALEPKPFHGEAGRRLQHGRQAVYQGYADGRAGTVGMKDRVEAYRKLNALLNILGRSVRGLADPAREPVVSIRRMAERIIQDLEKTGGINPRNLSINRRDFGRDNFGEMSSDPAFLAQEEAWRLVMLHITEGIFIDFILGNTQSRQAMDSMLYHRSANIRGSYANALRLTGVSGVLDADVESALLASLDEAQRDIFDIKISALLKARNAVPGKIRNRLIELLNNHQTPLYVRANAAYGLGLLMDKRFIRTADLEVFSSLIRAYSENSINRIGLESLGTLGRMDFSNDPNVINRFSKNTKQLVMHAVNNMDYEKPSKIYINGQPHVPEFILIKTILPFNMMQRGNGLADREIFDASVAYINSIFGNGEALDAQNKALSLIASTSPEKRISGYNIIDNLVQFHPENIEAHRALRALVSQAVVEQDYDYGARKALFETIRNLRVNWFLLQQEQHVFADFALNLHKVLESANDIEKSDIMRVFGKRALNDPNGKSLWPATLMISDFPIGVI